MATLRKHSRRSILLKIRVLAAILGRLNFCGYGHPWCRWIATAILLKARSHGFNPHATGWSATITLPLPPAFLDEAALRICANHPRPWRPSSPPAFCLESDASLWGYGAILRNASTRKIVATFPEQWARPMGQQNVAEATGICAAIHETLHYLRQPPSSRCHLRITTDNVQVLAALNNRGKTPRILRAITTALATLPDWLRMSARWRAGLTLQSDTLSRGKEFALAHGERARLEDFLKMKVRLLDWRSMTDHQPRHRYSLPLAIFLPWKSILHLPTTAKGILLYPIKKKTHTLKAIGWKQLPITIRTTSTITGEKLQHNVWWWYPPNP